MSGSTPAGPPATAPPRERTDAPPPGDGAVDWARVAALPEFQRLHASRRRFAIGGTVAATLALVLVFGLYGWAPDAMTEPLIGSITWALALGLALITLTFALAWAYARKAREWDRMATDVLERVEQGPVQERRFAR